MKLKPLALALSATLLAACGPGTSADVESSKAEASTAGSQESPSKYSSDTDRASYGIGLNMANNVKGAPFELNEKALLQGVKDGLEGAEQKVTQEDISGAIKSLQEAYFERQKQENEQQVKEGEAYLAENAKKSNIQVTESGLQYEVIKSGTGRSPVATDTVKTHYHGTLINGEVFDSSVDRGEPSEFQVNRVIKGWTEALQLMKEGDKWRLHIPSELAYGERSPSPKIPTNATLVFEVELLEVVEQKAAQASKDGVDHSSHQNTQDASKTAATQ